MAWRNFSLQLKLQEMEKSYITRLWHSLENNRFLTPLILSLPASVLSLTSKEILKVKVSMVLGSSAPPLSVKLKQIFSSKSQDATVMNQELKFDSKEGLHYLDALPESIDVGSYIFSFEVVLEDPENKNIFVTGGRARAVYITGVIKINHAEVSILDSDVGSVESQNKLDLNGQNEVALSANHPHKLRISLQSNTPLGHAFKPHQAFLKLRLGGSGKNLEINLANMNFSSRLATPLWKILSHNIWVMSSQTFLTRLRRLRPPIQPTEPYSRYGPKAEINHIFRAPKKRPRRELSLAFLSLVLLPFIGFVVGLLRLGVNLKNFPNAAVSSVFALLFHVGIGSVLLLYSLLRLRLNLFTTLKALGFLGVFFDVCWA